MYLASKRIRIIQDTVLIPLPQIVESPHEPQNQVFVQLRRKLTNEASLGLLVRIRYRVRAKVLSQDL